MMLSQRIDSLKKEINSAAAISGTCADDVHIICVTKYAKMEDVIDVIKLGYFDIGENRFQEANRKRALLKEALTAEQFNSINWHFIGHLQRNKAADVMEFAHLIQSVDSLRLARRIDEVAVKLNKKADILLQIKISDEESKFGVAFSEIDELVEEVLKLSHVNIKGFMGIGPYVEDPEESRSGFKQLRACFDNMNKLLKEKSYPQMSILSMGMSNDYTVALEEGSNMIRIGSAIFGG